MSHAFVHIGTHKTGTTAFQHWLDQHREVLRTRCGVGVHPGFFMPSHIELAHLSVRNSLITPDRLLFPDSTLPRVQDQLRAHVLETIRSTDSVVAFSCEGLSFIRESGEVARLCDLLAPRSVTVAVVFRRPDEYLRSYRETHLRWDGLQGPFLDPCSVMNTEPDSWLADYDAIRRVWSSHPAVSNFVEFDYDECLRSAGSVIPALGAAMGLEGASIPDVDGPWLNASSDFPPSYAELREQVESLNQAHSDLMQDLEAANAQRRSALQHARECEDSRQVLLASASWRVTAPLRWLASSLRRIRA
jgi:hypothetical protein